MLKPPPIYAVPAATLSHSSHSPSKRGSDKRNSIGATPELSSPTCYSECLQPFTKNYKNPPAIATNSFNILKSKRRW